MEQIDQKILKVIGTGPKTVRDLLKLPEFAGMDKSPLNKAIYALHKKGLLSKDQSTLPVWSLKKAGDASASSSETASGSSSDASPELNVKAVIQPKTFCFLLSQVKEFEKHYVHSLTMTVVPTTSFDEWDFRVIKTVGMISIYYDEQLRRNGNTTGMSVVIIADPDLNLDPILYICRSLKLEVQIINKLFASE